MNSIVWIDGVTVFLGIMVEAMPFVLLGVIASSFIRTYVSTDFLLRVIPKNPILAAFSGAMIGFVFPVCECGNIPLARRLILKKVPPFVVITFLLAAPVLNPIVIAATYTAFRDQLEILWLRLAMSLFVAMAIGLIFYLVGKPEKVVRPHLMEENAGHDHDCKIQGKLPKFLSFLSGMRGEFIEMTAILSFGALIASFSQVIVPREVITSIGTNAFTSILAMMLLAAVISICSNVDSFFALSYVNTFTPGSILAFLVFGPMIDIKAIAMLRTTFSTGAVFWLSFLAFKLTLVLTLFYNYFLSP